MSTGLGVGAYPKADHRVVAKLNPPLVLAMDWDPHNLQDLGYQGPVIMRHWQERQIDFDVDPEREGHRWAGMLTAQVRAHKGRYSALVGPNEYVGEDSTPEHWDWAGFMELELASTVQGELNLPYFGFSLPPGHGSEWHWRMPSVTKALGRMYGVCYHGYNADPDKLVGHQPWTLEARADWGWFWRPCTWLPVWQDLGVVRPVLLGECGTFKPWTIEKVKPVDYVSLGCAEASAAATWDGPPCVGACLFALGAEDNMGKQWNVTDDAALMAWAGHNHETPYATLTPALPEPAQPAARWVLNHRWTTLRNDSRPDAHRFGERAPWLFRGTIVEERPDWILVAEDGDPELLAWVLAADVGPVGPP